MKVLTILSVKGGVGKSSLAVCLAVAAERSGKTVVLFDMDPQRTLLKWSQRREADSPEVLTLDEARLDEILILARDQGVDWLVVDTQPRLQGTAAGAAVKADIVIIPTRPAVADLETVTKSLELAGDTPAVGILTFVPPRGLRGNEARAILQEMGLRVGPFMGNRVIYDYAMAEGLVPQELDHGSKAAAEIDQVYKFVNATLHNQSG